MSTSPEDERKAREAALLREVADLKDKLKNATAGWSVWQYARVAAGVGILLLVAYLVIRQRKHAPPPTQYTPITPGGTPIPVPGT